MGFEIGNKAIERLKLEEIFMIRTYIFRHQSQAAPHGPVTDKYVYDIVLLSSFSVYCLHPSDLLAS